MRAGRAGRWLVLLAALALVVWIRLLPLARSEPTLRYTGADGREHVYLADYDSYAWLRTARNYLDTGTTCDAVVAGVCRDTYTMAPLGAQMIYNRSLHIAAIVAVHRLITLFSPHYPLAASAFFVPVIVGALGVVPAFAIGWRLAGVVGGLAAAVLIGVNPLFLERSVGSDNDVWNLVLPLWMIWAAMAALHAPRLRSRVAYALLAGICAGLHAATWSGWVFTYGVLMLGLLAHGATRVLRAARCEGLRVWRVPAVRDALLVGVVVYVAAGLCTTLAGATGYVRLPLAPLELALGTSSGGASPPATLSASWPNMFQTVAELTLPSLGRIAKNMSDPTTFFVAWLGLLLLVLPRRRWEWWHFVILVGGNFLYRYLLTATELSGLGLVALLGAPLLAAVLLFILADTAATDVEQGAELIVVVWFLAALYLSYHGLRFVMLLVPPFALAFAVALGRTHQWLAERASRLGPRLRWPAAGAAFVACAAVLVAPASQGYTAAKAITPPMNAAWWDTLTMLRAQTPADAIVNTWWDYGYWVEYVADRRVSVDGGGLRTHVPYWLGRALLAGNEAESVGLLRMLNCGSDATPLPEGRAGAFGKLTAAGIDELTAHAIVLRLASLDREAARASLAERGLSAAVQEDVLASTHCTPPPSYLVLSSAMASISAWRYAGGWDFEKAYIAKQLRGRPEGEAVTQLVERFGYGEQTARAVYRAAGALRSDAEVRNFIVPRATYLSRGWLPCRRDSGGGAIVCRAGVRLDRAGTVLDAVTLFPDRPAATRLRIHRAARSFEGTPGAVLLAGATRLDETPVPAPTRPDVGVLVDLQRNRLLVGSPALLRSTFTQLMYLDGRYTLRFEKVTQHIGYRGERVAAWKVRWEGPP